MRLCCAVNAPPQNGPKQLMHDTWWAGGRQHRNVLQDGSPSLRINFLSFSVFRLSLVFLHFTLSLFFLMSICLSLFLPVFLYICLYQSISVCPSIGILIYLSTRGKEDKWFPGVFILKLCRAEQTDWNMLCPCLVSSLSPSLPSFLSPSPFSLLISLSPLYISSVWGKKQSTKDQSGEHLKPM